MNCEHQTTAAPMPTTAEAAWQENKRLLLAALVASGACTANVTYVGIGDSGGIEGVSVEMPEGLIFDPSTPVTVFVDEGEYVDRTWRTRVVAREARLEDAIRDFAEESIERCHSGYENEDGGAGEVIFDCDAKTVRIEHNDYYTDSEYTETQL